jgi:DNA polymerase-1
MGARTSRWTCKAGDLPNGANLQNYSREYKGVFGVPPDSGLRIVSADYSTLEIRIVCAITGELNMYKALKAGTDIHRHTASMIFNKPVDQITGKERSNSKPANFGFAYAMSSKTFIGYAFDLYGIKFTEQESREIRNKWFKAYPAIGKYHEWIGRQLRRGNLILETALGYRAKPNSYTEAANLATQGTGAECGRLAIHRLVKKDARALNYFVNFIHDSFYLIVPEDETDYWSKLLEDSMVEAWYEISKSRLFKFKDIPMPVEVVTGYNMSDLSDEFEGGGQSLSVEEMRAAQQRTMK